MEVKRFLAYINGMILEYIQSLFGRNSNPNKGKMSFSFLVIKMLLILIKGSEY